MDLRVTAQTMMSRSIASVRRQTARMGNLQEQAATGKRLLRPSDGPLETTALLASKAEDSRLETYLTNIRDTRATLDVSVSALQDANDILTSARTVAIEASHATNDNTSVEALADEVDALLNRLITVANTKYLGRSIFSGTATQSQAFTVSSEDPQGHPLAVGYRGSADRAVATVNSGQLVEFNYPGTQVFQQRQRQMTAFTGDTGAAPGTGTDSATGQGSLLLRHISTTYEPGSGVLPGVDSPSGDTILGPVGTHRLTLIDTSGNGSSGTVSLDGGPAVTFNNADTNLAVTGPKGDVVYVDTTAITPGFSGDVAISAAGTLSVDGGTSEVAIDFSQNQQVFNSVTGQVTNVDSRAIQRTGAERLDYAGTYDAFQILMALRDDLRNTAGLTDADRSETISRRLAELDRVRATVLDVVGEQSSSLQNLDSLEQRLQDVQLETQKRTSDIESADISQIVLDMQSQDNALRLTLAAAARVMDQSLLDFLR